MDRPLPDISSLRPAGGKRSTKRDRILSIFVRQQGHLSADDLCDLVRREDPGIGRATVYRTLQWMVGAGVARKVDFGDGRSRFEPAYRHPRHFHLICTTCHRSFEFLSSDVESLLEEIAMARSFVPTQTVVQVSGTCEACRTGTTPAPIDGSTTELVFARDALRIAIATERGGLEFYNRAASLTSDPRGRGVFQRLAAEEREHLSTLETRYRELLAEDPQLESRPAFLFFKGAASGLFAEGTEKLRRGIDDLQALLIGIKCERGSHKFFKRYGERFEDSEGKRIFLEFADEERAHLDLLIREFRALRERRGVRRSPKKTGHGQGAALIDLHTHTTASDGRCTPAELVARAAAAGVTVLSVTDHDTVAGYEAAAAVSAAAGVELVPGIEMTAIVEGVDVHVLGYFIDVYSPRLLAFLAEQRLRRIDRVRQIIDRLAAHGIVLDSEAILQPGLDDPSITSGRPWIARALVAGGHVADSNQAFDRWLGQGRPAFVPRRG